MGLPGWQGWLECRGRIARRKETCEGGEEMQDKETNKRGTRNDRALASAVLPFLLISRPHLSSSSAFWWLDISCGPSQTSDSFTKGTNQPGLSSSQGCLSFWMVQNRMCLFSRLFLAWCCWIEDALVLVIKSLPRILILLISGSLGNLSKTF